MNTNTPYANLSPDVILNAVESLDFACSGSLLSLNSYENRVYQVGIDDSTPIIAKFYRPGRWTDAAIIEEHQFALELKNHEIPVIAPLEIKGATLHQFADFRFAIFPRQGGRTFELDNLDHLEWMGRFIGRLHAVGACRRFQHRIEINSDTYGRAPYEFLKSHQFFPADVADNFHLAFDMLIERVDACFALAGDVAKIRLHGDCHAGNVLWNDAGPQIVDLDDCLQGPAIQDIWMLLSGNERDKNIQTDIILEGYQEFFDFDYRELHLIEAMRALRMMHYIGWLAKRWEDPAFPLNFPWFNTPNYWQEQLQHLREQVGVLDKVLEKDED